MKYSIIYSVDHTGPEVPKEFYPVPIKQWRETESGASECRHLGGDWADAVHKKWVGFLTQKQFDQFIDHTDLDAEDIGTMGSIGAPGFGVGWAPAIAFTNNGDSVMMNAYVTPCPERKRMPKWERVRTWIIDRYNVYGNRDEPVPAAFLPEKKRKTK